MGEEKFTANGERGEKERKTVRYRKEGSEVKPIKQGWFADLH